MKMLRNDLNWNGHLCEKIDTGFKFSSLGQLSAFHLSSFCWARGRFHVAAIVHFPNPWKKLEEMTYDFFISPGLLKTKRKITAVSRTAADAVATKISLTSASFRRKGKRKGGKEREGEKKPVCFFEHLLNSWKIRGKLAIRLSILPFSIFLWATE